MWAAISCPLLSAALRPPGERRPMPPGHDVVHGGGRERGGAGGREEGRLDPVAAEQLDQPPDADPAAELTLGELLRRLGPHAAPQAAGGKRGGGGGGRGGAGGL